MVIQNCLRYVAVKDPYLKIYIWRSLMSFYVFLPFFGEND